MHEYRCDGNHEFEEVRHFGEQVSFSKCPKCGGMAYKVWNAPSIRDDITPHYQEQLGAYITSRAQEREVIKRLEERSGGQIQIDWH